jgi:GTP-binding protein HflX
VRDVAADETEAQARDVALILEQLGVDPEVPQIEVWNKLDLLPPDTRAARETEAARNPDVVAISALTGAGIEALVTEIEARLGEVTIAEDLHLTFAQGRNRAWLHDAHVVTDEVQDDTGWRIAVDWTARQKADYDRQVG